MTLSRSRTLLIAVAALVLLTGIGVVLVRTPGPRAHAASAPSPTSSSSPSAEPTAELAVRLGRVQGRGPSGIVKTRTLRKPAETIRQTMTELYSTAFVDAQAWNGETLPGLDRFFAPAARERVPKDLDELSLGRTAARLAAMRVAHARVDVQFVTDAGGHAEVAFADVSFTATGIGSGGARLSFSQDGRYVLRKLHGAWRIESYEVRAKVPAAEQVRTRSARFAPGPPTDHPLFILLIGSDARPHQAVGATRGDSLHIVSVNPRLGRGAIVGIPRDSYVPIPGHGTNKINASLYFGGPELVERTVEQLTGVRFDGYLLTGFDGFRRIVDAIGGLDVRVPYPMNDADSGAHFRPGPTHLNGREALAFSRDRHDVPGGDFGRSMNQGRVIVSALKAAREAAAKDPARLVPWLVSALRFVKTDLSLSQMTELLLAATTLDPGRIRTTVVSGSGAVANGQSIVRLGPGARSIFRDIARDGVLGGR